MSRLVLRELRRLAEFEAVQEVARNVWGFEDRQLPSTFDLQAVGHAGGLTAGVFNGTEMAGFVHGLPRTNLAEACQHSHMLAVRPEWQGRGLAVRLKFFQRSWCPRRGIRLVTWTYDPLLVKNARLNLVRLRARAKRYLPNFYGPLGGTGGQLPSDRFEVHWKLDAGDVERAARGLLPADHRAETLPRATSRRRPRVRRLAVEIPNDFGALLVSDPAAARRARLKLRRVVPELFASGYEAASIHLGPDSALYVFERR